MAHAQRINDWDGPDGADPWTLAVTFSLEDYREAASCTQAWLARPGRRVGVDYRPEKGRIVLAGPRWELVTQLTAYALWLSAQIDFRPSDAAPQEHPLTLVLEG